MIRRVDVHEGETPEALLYRMAKYVRATDDILDEVFGDEQYGIDEIAVLTTSSQQMNEMARSLVQHPDVTMFNAANDSVATWPIEDSYDVEYSFFQKEGEVWRIELMRRVDGVSPLHRPLELRSHQVNLPVLVHASFKVSSREEYDAVVKVMRGNDSLVMAQSCESTYGLFSYWQHEDWPLYIKPRVNTRDAS